MNKENIYKIIGYTGEYNQSVKKALKKLLKENHPDNNGNPKIFKLICDVKDELENNRVSKIIKEKSKSANKKSDEIDIEYCYSMLTKVESEKKKITKELQEKNNLLTEYENNYKKMYQESIDMEANFLNKSPNIKRINRIKTVSVIIVLLLIILFTFVVINNSLTLFIIFTILAFICIIIVQRYFIIVNNLVKNSKKDLKKYVNLVKEIKQLIIRENKLKREILITERKKKNIENNWRFYKNLLK